MTQTSPRNLRLITVLAVLLALVALFALVEHHHDTEESAQSCPLCLFPTSVVGILVAAVLTIIFEQTRRPVVVRHVRVSRPYVPWISVNRAPPFSA